VQDAALTAAVIKAYATLLMVGRYPVAILFIQLPASQVDVNVHPSKAEVRFRDPDRLFSALQRGIRRGLLAYSPIPEINTSLLWGRQPLTSDISERRLSLPSGQAWQPKLRLQLPPLEQRTCRWNACPFCAW